MKCTSRTWVMLLFNQKRQSVNFGHFMDTCSFAYVAKEGRSYQALTLNEYDCQDSEISVF